MALKRSHLRHLAFLLEFAPLTRSSVLPSAVARSPTHCMFRRPHRRLQSTATLRRATEQQRSPRAATASTAQGQLLVDLDHEKDAKLKSPSKGRVQAANVGRSQEQAALERLDQILSDAQLPVKRDRAATEKQALESLRICFDLARVFNEATSDQGSTTPAANLLFSLHEHPENSRGEVASLQARALKSRALDKIEAAAHNLVASPKIFITQEVLKMYVVFKSYLNRPQDLPAVFEMYANKPVPEPDSSPLRLKPAASHRPAAAIDLEIAHAALDAAMNIQDLPLCLDIIDKSVRTKAFRNHKLVSQALVPAVGVVGAPFLAYTVGMQFAAFSEHLTSSNAHWIGFAGISSYLLFTGTIGFVAITTANDQMQRVTWADGMPLRERWLREPERAMLDNIACSWGFRSNTRWGEEEGPEWDALKQLISFRSMVLDRVELMEGMN